jgi:hypothetical protein
MSWSGRLIDYLGQGTAASLPSAPTLAPGAAAFYFAYDTVAMYAWNGNTSAWDLVTATGMSNPMTTAGDMIVGGSSGTPTRFAAPTTGSTWYLSYVVGTGFVWGTIAGAGDMLAATYDPAGIAQQVVGTTATQALTNKDITDSSNTFPVALQAQHRGINDQTGTTYTLVLSDAGKDVRCNNASAIALTVPANSSVAFPVGTMIAFSQKGAGAVTASGASGVTVNAANGAATTAQYDARVLEKVDTDTWRIW